MLANGKTKVGPCWKRLFKANCQEGPIPLSMLGTLIKDHNTGITETKAAWVEQNTRQKAEPSTHYQVYRCIN